MEESQKEENFLGKGAFGRVYKRDGVAVKVFKSPTEMIKEFCSLLAVQNSKYVVKTFGVNLEKSEMYMRLYKCNLHQYLYHQRETITNDEKMKFFIGITRCLIDLHDRGLVHADVKLGNILLDDENKPILADFNLCRPEKYAKINGTTRTYREYRTERKLSHDIYSLGICYLLIFSKGETFKRRKKGKIYTYEEIDRIARKFLTPKKYNFCKKMITPNKRSRLTAREIYKTLAKEDPPKLFISVMKIERNDRIRNFFEKYSLLEELKETDIGTYIASAIFERNPKLNHKNLCWTVRYILILLFCPNQYFSKAKIDVYTLEKYLLHIFNEKKIMLSIY